MIGNNPGNLYRTTALSKQAMSWQNARACECDICNRTLVNMATVGLCAECAEQKVLVGVHYRVVVCGDCLHAEDITRLVAIRRQINQRGARLRIIRNPKGTHEPFDVRGQVDGHGFPLRIRGSAAFCARTLAESYL